jgi:hypothetical protein
MPSAADQDPPTVSVIATAFESDQSTQVEEVQLSANGLTVRMASNQWSAQVFFQTCYGFRVLDELDLTEFWSQCTLLRGWLYEVSGGGWKDLELRRPTFISGQHAWTKEYLIVGLNECVSVLSKDFPVVSGS